MYIIKPGINVNLRNDDSRCWSRRVWQERWYVIKIDYNVGRITKWRCVRKKFFFQKTNTETEMSSRWLPGSSIEKLKASFNVTVTTRAVTLTIFPLLWKRFVSHLNFIPPPPTTTAIIAIRTGLILGLRPANETRRYFVTTSLIAWVQA